MLAVDTQTTDTITRKPGQPSVDDQAFEALLDSDVLVDKLLANAELTEIDLVLGQRYFELLLKHVKNTLATGESDPEIRITYGALVDELHRNYKKKPHTEAAIAVNIGRRLYATKLICERCNLPNLAGVAVNNDGTQGRSYKGDWNAEKTAILTFPWDAAQDRISTAFAEERAAVGKRAGKPLKERLWDVAANYFFHHIYKTNERVLKGQVTREQMEQIVHLLLERVAPKDAVLRVTGIQL
jgi:hypothetical protein